MEAQNSPERMYVAEAEHDLRRALRKRKDWTARVKRARSYLARYEGLYADARLRLLDAGVDPAEIVEDELQGYSLAYADDINLQPEGG